MSSLPLHNKTNWKSRKLALASSLRIQSRVLDQSAVQESLTNHACHLLNRVQFAHVVLSARFPDMAVKDLSRKLVKGSLVGADEH